MPTKPTPSDDAAPEPPDRKRTLRRLYGGGGGKGHRAGVGRKLRERDREREGERALDSRGEEGYA